MAMGGMEMGGMEMGTSGPFRPINMRLARGLWYAIAAFVGILTLSRLVLVLENYRRRKHFRRDPRAIPSRPHGLSLQVLATATAVLREVSYSQPLHFSGRISKHFTPLTTGQCIILLVYWAVLLSFLWSGTIIPPGDPMYAYKWEKPAFRAAWVSVSQIPLVYLLSCKLNPISLLTGISYERFHWLHRWAARTVFLTIILHWSFFFREWWLADFVKLEIAMMPMVKYGFGAWAVVGWMVFSGSFRHFGYEVFVLQHICAAATLLWLIHTHVPSYARYNVYMAIGFVTFDWGGRAIFVLIRNTRLLDLFSPRGSRSRAIGFRARLTPLAGDAVRVTVYNANFAWKPGQHCYMSIPAIRLFELHPFTIASLRSQRDGRDGRDAPFQLVIKARAGFTRALQKVASKADSSDTTFRVFLSGPWGHPPDLTHFETVVFVACGNGASFTVPQLLSLLRDGCCASKIDFHWIIRAEDHLNWFVLDIIEAAERAGRATATLSITLHVTQSRLKSDKTEPVSSLLRHCPDDVLPPPVTAVSPSPSSGALSLASDEKAPLSPANGADNKCKPCIRWQYRGRPSVRSLIRPAVETARGETAIVLCGGPAITAQARTFVTALSDDRAVHKGTGSQGIFLFCESYGW